jgi:hypothetical protein
LFNSRLHQEKGQVLPIALAVLALGILVVAPFLSHAGTVLKNSGQYRQLIEENYACEAGVEQAIWALTNNALPGDLTAVGSSLKYNLNPAVNSFNSGITITLLSTSGEINRVESGDNVNSNNNIYLVNSSAGGTTITAKVAIANGNSSISSWKISP